MPKFVQEIIEDYFWAETSFENPDFPDLSEEEIRIKNAFVLENIVTI